MGVEYILHCNPRQIFKPVWTRKRGGGALCYVGEARPQGEEQSLEAVERYLEREHWGGFRYRFSDLKRSVEKACHCIDKPRLLKAFNADFQKTFDVDFCALGALRSVAVPLPFCEVPSVDVWVAVSRYSTQPQSWKRMQWKGLQIQKPRIYLTLALRKE